MRRLALVALLAAFVGHATAAPPTPAVLWRATIAPDGQSIALTPEGPGKFNIVANNGVEFLWIDPATGIPWVYNLTISTALTPPGPPPPPPIVLIESFTASPESVKKGEPSTLTWRATKAKTVTLNSVTVATAGTQVVKPDATMTFTLVASDGAKSETAQRIVTVTDIPPPPPVPTELRVLVVEDVTQRDKLTAGQREILFSELPGGVLDYMRKNCAKGPDGKTPEYKIVDKRTTFELMSPAWQKAKAKFDELKVPVPGWIVSGGDGPGGSSALPADPAAALEILKKYTPATKGGK